MVDRRFGKLTFEQKKRRKINRIKNAIAERETKFIITTNLAHDGQRKNRPKVKMPEFNLPKECE